MSSPGKMVSKIKRTLHLSLGFTCGILLSGCDFIESLARPSSEVTREALLVSASKAEDYFESRGNDLSTDAVLMLLPFGKKYELNWYERQRIRVANSLLKTPSALSPFAAMITDVNEVPEVDSPSLHQLDRLTLPALYCDRLDLSDEFFRRLELMTETGGYKLPHAVGALQWAVEKGCLSFSNELLELRDRQVTLMEKQAEETEVGDLFYEVVGMLYYIDEGDKVRQEWLQKILDSQLDSGAWPSRPGAEANDHSSVFAYWAIKEAVSDNDKPLRFFSEAP